MEPCDYPGMAQNVCILLSDEDRTRLAAIVGDRNRSQKHVQRARIVLLSADRLSVLAVARQAGASRPAVWRWQQRFAEQGVEGLLRDKTRKPGKNPLRKRPWPKSWRSRAASRPASDALDGAHGRPGGWCQSARCAAYLGQATVFSPTASALSSAPATRHSPQRSKTCRPLHGSARSCRGLSIDEKSQIQALDRTQPGLPMKPGKCGTMTHDYKRNGTTTLFAAFNILDGVVLGRCMQRHTHQEFIRFLNAVERVVPADKPSTPSPTTTPPISIPKSSCGSPAIRAGCSTSRQPRAPGSTPSKISSPPSPEDKSGAVSSNPSPTSRTPSTAISTRTMIRKTVPLDQTRRRHPRQAQPTACTF